ncbi:MAG: helix-hairpin-helix domain-containing protein [Candidatus Omnitrophota bacterium]
MLILKNKLIFLITFLFILAFTAPLHAKTFKIATYNVENLFDLEPSGNEYIEYLPNNIFNWNQDTLNIKLNNIAQVIKDLNADIIALEEIESEQVLKLLLEKLKENSLDYPYYEIAQAKNTVVKCAVLSKYPISKTWEIPINNSKVRNILKVAVFLETNPLILYINHWKSKQGPESLRIASALALRKDIDTLAADTDFIILGDFNSNYNEDQSIKNSKRFNNTKGLTGINNILNTTLDSKMVTENFLSKQKNNKYLYNLWLELPASKRWSYNASEHKNSPDSIILSHGLYDAKGISYLDNSFDRFTANYLFNQGQIFRWQREKNGRGMHLGAGYSDHLPIFASFSTDPFTWANQKQASKQTALNKANQSIEPQGQVDLNIGTKKELMAIKGIGKITADKIISARPFKTVDDLLKVKGIGKKKLEAIREFFRVDQPANR